MGSRYYEDQSVTILNGEPGKSTHESVVSRLVPVGEDFADGFPFPSLATVFAFGSPSSLRVDPFGGPVPSGIVIDRAIRQFRDGRFAGSLGRERITGLPSLSLVIAVDCIGVVLGPSGIVVFSGIPTGRADDPSLVFAMPEGNPVLVHVHGRNVSVFVFLDYAIVLLPSLCVVIAAVYGELARGVTILHESEDRTGRFVHRDASAHESFSHFDYLAKGFSTVFAPAANHPVPKGQNRSVHANHDVRHPVVFEKLFGFENRLANKRTDLVLPGFGRLAEKTTSTGSKSERRKNKGFILLR